MSEMKTWNVICGGHHLGTVDEANAGCEALSVYGLDDDEWSSMTEDQRRVAHGRYIPPGAPIEVTPA